MPAKQDPNLGLNWGWAYGEDGWGTGMDANMKAVAALLHCSVVSATTAATPGAPTAGDRYIVPASGVSGAWVGSEGKLAVYIEAAWEYHTPKTGWRAWVEDESRHRQYTGSAWEAIDPYDVGGTYNGAPGSSVAILRYPVPRTVTLPAGLTGSQGVLRTAATAQTDFDIQKNQVSVGTMRFAAAGTVATFIMATDTTFTAGDVLEVIAPAVPDATAADIGFSLAGLR